MKPSCHYHPNRDAITKCEQCGKLICIECKMIFRKQHSAGTSEHRTYYVTQHEVCPPCFYDLNIKTIKNPGRIIAYLIIGLMLVIIGAFFYSWMYNLLYDIMSGDVTFLLITSIYIVMIIAGLLLMINAIRIVILFLKKLKK